MTPPVLQLVSSRPAGGAYFLRALWDRRSIDQSLNAALADRDFTAPVREALFAIVANRALAPSSKRAIEQWSADDVYLGHDEKLQVQHFYRAMDFLVEHADTIQHDVFWSTANLLNLTVDPGRFTVINDTFHIKKVERRNGTETRHYVIAYNPEQAARDRDYPGTSFETPGDSTETAQCPAQ